MVVNRINERVMARMADYRNPEWSLTRTNIDNFYWATQIVALDIHVTLKGRGDLSVRIYRQLVEAVVDGRLRRGERVPPTRELARRLSVCRNTVAVAYERLAAEGFLVSRVGDGTFVAADQHGPARDRRAPRGDIAARPLWASSGAESFSTPAPVPYDFRVGAPDPQLFPLAAWRRCVARELRPAAVLAPGADEASGHAGLRRAIARHIGVSRAVNAAADDVLVTHGTQQALDLIGRVLLEPGACVAVEEPGYVRARQLFTRLGARVVGVPVDADGLDVSAIPRAARLIYVTPSHQFPLGVAMSLERRIALLAWANSRRAVVVEDDYDSEFRFHGRPLDPLQSLDRDGRVIYVGSFSKIMRPVVRLGFLVAPASLQPALRAAKQLTDSSGILPTQAALARFIDEGLLSKHIRKAAREYAARHERIIEVLRRDFGRWLTVIPSSAGLHLAARVVPGASIDLTRVIARALDAGVRVYSLARFSVEPPRLPGLVIGYGAIPRSSIDEGLRRLRRCFASAI
jgi:GntR family transcriptional regulator/MocR family aminotransferase